MYNKKVNLMPTRVKSRARKKKKNKWKNNYNGTIYKHYGLHDDVFKIQYKVYFKLLYTQMICTC